MKKTHQLPPLPKNKLKEYTHNTKINSITQPQGPAQFQTVPINIVPRPPTREKYTRPLSSRSSSSVQSQKSACVTRNKSKGNLQSSRGHPQVSARSWILYEMNEGQLIAGKRQHKRRQIASLTKMINLLTILGLVDRLKLDPTQIRARATQRSSSVIGTTANLKFNQTYNLYDLYFGMMLPSGNDAATMIAQIGGYILKLELKGIFEPLKLYDEGWLSTQIKDGCLVQLYLGEMNRLAKKLGMRDTNLANPHGLSNRSSYSTAHDLAKFCSQAMKNKIFREVVSTRMYEYSLPNQTDEENKENQSYFINQEIIASSINSKQLSLKKNSKSLVWENTNRMLGVGWTGIKTGITPNAGPCLAASYQHRQKEYLIILLSSISMEARWHEVDKLVGWVLSKKKRS